MIPIRLQRSNLGRTSLHKTVPPGIPHLEYAFVSAIAPHSQEMAPAWGKMLDCGQGILYLTRIDLCTTLIIDTTGYPKGSPGRSSRLRLSLRLVMMALVGTAVLVALPVAAYMPPPDPCELAPMTYGPPPPPNCPGPPPLATCGPCPPMRCYPRKVVGCPPGPIMVCTCPQPPTMAAYKVCAPPPCPPPCGPPPCGPTIPGLQ